MTRGIEAGSGAGDWRISENPDGSRHIFLVTGDETGGEYLRLRLELPPHASGPPMHYHVGYTEKFDVLEGRLEVYVGKKNHLAFVSGQSASVPLKAPHKFWNATDEPYSRPKFAPPVTSRRLSEWLTDWRGTERPAKAACRRIRWSLA